MTSNAVLAVYDLSRVAPPVDAAVVDAVTAALSRGEDAQSARESHEDFAARTELARCILREGHLQVARRFPLESAGVDEKTGEPKPPPYSDRLRAAFDVCLCALTDPASGPPTPAIAPLSEYDQAPYWPQAVRITERRDGRVLTTYCDPTAHRMRSHVTRGADKAGPPPCTCKSDWGELVADPHCAVNGHHGRIGTVHYAPDGGVLVSSGRGEVMVWDARTHAPLATLRGAHEDRGAGARCAKQTLVTWGGTTLKAWDLEQVLRAGMAPRTCRRATHSG